MFSGLGIKPLSNYYGIFDGRQEQIVVIKSEFLLRADLPTKKMTETAPREVGRERPADGGRNSQDDLV